MTAQVRTPTGGRSSGDRFRELIRSITGISLPPSKVQMIDQRLRRRVVAFALPDTEAYLDKLWGGDLPEDELKTVIDLITTNTTSFFRESDHFDSCATRSRRPRPPKHGRASGRG